MRKRFIVPDRRIERDEQWLDLTQLAALEVTSESDSHPIESAILHNAKGGWCAAAPGKQTIRIVFDEPQSLTRVLLVFEEHVVARSQEFVLRWRADGHESDCCIFSVDFWLDWCCTKQHTYRIAQQRCRYM